MKWNHKNSGSHRHIQIYNKFYETFPLFPCKKAFYALCKKARFFQKTLENCVFNGLDTLSESEPEAELTKSRNRNRNCNLSKAAPEPCYLSFE
jgi:hypothetical protein